ncbi:gluconokinase [Nocardioidaceae bacterium SCSIO 66511]|nr:gluconokinase [Nocardioidaceae bacterium SCSIO 66511]
MAEHSGTRAPLVVIMGVSAVGKTTVGERLAARYGVEYADADAFHPQANIDKMSAGVPLSDDDRWPWLEAIGRWLHERRDTGGVVSCSALKRAYRDVLVEAAPALCFLHLDGDPEMIRERIARRKDHFMPPSLVDSQLATLEPLEPDECGVAIDLTKRPDEIIEEFCRYAKLR